MEFFNNYERGLIVHHWDTDGICSAGMLLSELKGKADNLSPEIGNFYLTDSEIDSIKDMGYEFISIVDICMPKENILKLKASTAAKLFIFDHHLQERILEVEHINPVSEGKSPERFPSTSWVLSPWLGINLLTVLGAVGDLEERIKENQAIYPEIENFLNSSSLEFSSLMRMVELIDSNYKVMDKEGVETAAQFVMENKGHPEKVLEHRGWIQNAERIEREIKTQLSREIVENGNFLILKIDTPFNIISTMTRRLAWQNPGRIAIVINRGFFPDRDQIYVRGDNVGSWIEMARNEGYSAGGKKGVAGIVLPKERTSSFIERMLK